MNSRVEASANANIQLAIPANNTKSNAFHIGAYCQCGFILPATFTGAQISFEVSADGENFYAAYTAADALVAVAVTQGRAYVFPLDLFPWSWVKLVSDATENAERTIVVSAKY